MNVMEEILKKKIDPLLTTENLSLLGSKALSRKVRAVSAEVLTGGCWNRVVAVSFQEEAPKGKRSASVEDPELVFKINPEEGNFRLAREFGVLDYFARNTEMPVPQPLLLDDSGSLIPGSVLVMSRLPGHALHRVYGLLDRDARQGLSEQIGRTVAELHGHRSEEFGAIELPQGKRLREWPDFWLPRFDAVLEDAIRKNAVDTSTLEEIAAARESFTAWLSVGHASTLTHYDIWSGNVMVDIEDSSLAVSGYLDIPGFWADYARELSFMEMFGLADGHFYDVYRSYHTLDEGFELRKNVYNFKMHLKHVMMYPDQDSYRNGVRECLRFIRSR